FFLFSVFQRPSWLNTFSCAFSRIEQVLTRMTSASASLSVSSRPCSAASTSAILSESYSFVWHPWVLMKSLPAAGLPVMGNATCCRGKEMHDRRVAPEPHIVAVQPALLPPLLSRAM